MKSTSSSTRRRQRGMTLIEIMVVHHDPRPHRLRRGGERHRPAGEAEIKQAKTDVQTHRELGVDAST